MTPARPDTVCQPCWRTWHAAGALAPAVGYCHHTRTAWRIKPSGEVQTIEATRDDVKAMRELLDRPEMSAP